MLLRELVSNGENKMLVLIASFSKLIKQAFSIVKKVCQKTKIIKVIRQISLKFLIDITSVS